MTAPPTTPPVLPPGLLEQWRDRLLASDPGLARLRTALRAVLGTVAAAALLVPAAHHAGQPVTVVLVGCIVAMQCGVAIADREPKQQARSLALAGLAACVAGTTAVFAMAVPWVGLTLFCAVIFCATLARRFGPPGNAAGMLAFMTYFFALFAHTRPAQLPWMLGAIVTGVVVAAAVRFAAVRDRPERIAANLRRAFGARLSAVLAELAVCTLAGGTLAAGTQEKRPAAADARRWRRLRAEAGQLDVIALSLDSATGPARPGDAADPASAWSAALFESELAAEMLVDACQHLSAEFPEDSRRQLAAAVVAVRRFANEGVEDACREAEREIAAACPDDGDAGPPDLEARDADSHAIMRRRARRAVHMLCAGRPWTVRPPGAEVKRPTIAGSGGPAGPGSPTSGWPAALRLAVQATVAGALAIVAGRAISSTRWYWAVIAAFVVFAQATTRGETLARAWRRVLGTVAGIVVGFAIAELVGRNTPVAIGIALLALFPAFYLLRVAYAGMVVFLTVALALFYEGMGRPVAGLLGLRLVETLAGAVIGGVVSVVVLPARSGAKVRVLVATLLRAAAKPIARVTASGGAAGSDRAGLIADIRGVDRALVDVRGALSALTGTRISGHPGDVVRHARAAESLAYAVRRLGVAALDGAARDNARDEGTVVAESRTVGARLAQNCDRMAAALEREGGREDAAAPPLQPVDDDIARLRRTRPTGPRRLITEALADIAEQLAAIASYGVILRGRACRGRSPRPRGRLTPPRRTAGGPAPSAPP